MERRRGVTDFLRIFEVVGATFFDIEEDLLVVLDEQGNISRVNPAFQKALNYHEADVFGVPLIQLVHADDWAKFIKAFNWHGPPQPFRLLRSTAGEMAVNLIAVRFRNGKGYLVMRSVE